MGTWNTGILENDRAMDVYSFFEKLYNKQDFDIETTKLKTLDNFNLLSQSNEPVYGNEEWLAYAYICWECQALDKQTLEAVRTILNNKEEIEEDWEELAEKRIEVIGTFLNKIQTPAKRKKSIKKQFIPQIPFQEGDCVVFKDKDGIWGGVIYLEIDKSKSEDPNMWSFYIGTTRIFSQTKPTLDNFINSHFLVINYGKTIDGRDANWIKTPEIFIGGRFVGDVKNEKEKDEIEKQLTQYEIVGKLQFVSKPQYKQSWTKSLILYHKYDQFEWENRYPHSIDLSYPIKDYLLRNEDKEEPKRAGWKFWEK